MAKNTLLRDEVLFELNQGFGKILQGVKKFEIEVETVLMAAFIQKAPNAFSDIDQQNPTNSIIKPQVINAIGGSLVDGLTTLKQMCKDQADYYQKQWSELSDVSDVDQKKGLFNKLIKEHKDWMLISFGKKLDDTIVGIEDLGRESFPHYFSAPKENIVTYSKWQLQELANKVEMPQIEIPKIKVASPQQKLISFNLDTHPLGNEMKALLESVKQYDTKVPSLIAQRLQQKLPNAFYPFGQDPDLQFLKPNLKKIPNIFTEQESIKPFCEEQYKNLKDNLFPLVLLSKGDTAKDLLSTLKNTHNSWKVGLASKIDVTVNHMEAKITQEYPNGDYDSDTTILDSIADLHETLLTGDHDNGEE